MTTDTAAERNILEILSDEQSTILTFWFSIDAGTRASIIEKHGNAVPPILKENPYETAEGWEPPLPVRR